MASGFFRVTIWATNNKLIPTQKDFSNLESVTDCVSLHLNEWAHEVKLVSKLSNKIRGAISQRTLQV